MINDNGVLREPTQTEIEEGERAYQELLESGLITEDDESSVGGVGKIVPIRTFIVGDESTYRTHDDVTCLEGDETGTKITKISIRETDDNKPRIEVQKALAKVIEMLKDEDGVSPMIYGTQRSYNTYCAPEFNN